jgi:hypothetical protein
MGWVRTEEDENRFMGRDCFRKFYSMTVHEWQMRTGDSVPNGHELYFPFILSHFKRTGQEWPKNQSCSCLVHGTVSLFVAYTKEPRQALRTRS